MPTVEDMGRPRPRKTMPLPVIEQKTPGSTDVRFRRVQGEIVTGFVAAEASNGLPYDAEIMGDDEYAEDDSLRRKLADAHLINAALETQSALRAVLTGALTETPRRGRDQNASRAMVRTVLAKAEGKA